jgi:hypothetical protein
MKDDIRILVEQVARSPFPDQWEEIETRVPRSWTPDAPTRSRAVALVVAIVFAFVSFAFAFESFHDRSSPGSEPSASATVPAVLPSLAGVPRISDSIPLPANTLAGSVAVGAGAVWAEVIPTSGTGENSLIRIDPATDRIEASIPVHPGRVVANDTGVWVTGRGVLERIDPGANAPLASVDLPGDVSAIAATSSDVWTVVIDGSAGGTLVRIDQATNSIVAETLLGPEFTGYQDQVLFGAGAVWVLGVRWNGKDQGAEEYGGDLIRVDPATNEIVARIPVDGFTMAVGDDAVWVKYPRDGVFDSSSEDWLWTKVDAVTNEPSAPFRMDTGSLGLVTSDGLWSVDYNDSNYVVVTRFDPKTHEVEARSAPIKSYFEGAVIDPLSGTVWISTQGTITRVDISG